MLDKTHRQSTVDRAKLAGRHLAGFFGADERAARIDETRIDAYKRYRLQSGAKLATLQVELAFLGRMFRLGQRAKKVAAVPFIEGVQPDNARQGWFERHQLDAILPHMPEAMRAPVLVGFLTGWRLRSEILTLENRDIDLHGAAMRLRPECSKTKQGRTRPLTGELLRIMTAQVEANKAWAQRTGTICKWLFHDDAGRPLQTLPKHWRRAAKAAGLGELLLHDMRRSFVRRMTSAGVPREVVMKFTGHRSESMFRRYRIIADSDMTDAARLLDTIEAAPKVAVINVQNGDNAAAAPATATKNA